MPHKKVNQDKLLNYTIKLITKLTSKKSSLALVDCILEELIKLPMIELCRLYEVHHEHGGTINSLMDINHLLFKEVMEKPWQAKDSSEPPSILAHCIVEAKPIAAPIEHSDSIQLAYPIIPTSKGLVRLLIIETNNEDLSHILLQTESFQALCNLFELFDLLERDQLTGFFNQHLLEESLIFFSDLAVQFTQQANRNGNKAWLTILEIEGIKQLKKEHGFLYYDDAVLVISYIIKCCFRSSDLLFRYQDGCFISLLVCDNEKEVECALHRLQKDLQKNWPSILPNDNFHVAFTSLDNDKPATLAIEQLYTALRHLKENQLNETLNFQKLQINNIQTDQSSIEGNIELF